MKDEIIIAMYLNQLNLHAHYSLLQDSEVVKEF